jgi:hypothetical protein
MIQIGFPQVIVSDSDVWDITRVSLRMDTVGEEEEAGF